MKKSNIGLYLSTLKPEGILALLRNVVAKMTGNPTFATPLVKLVDMTAKADELEAAIEDATSGSRGSKLVRNQLVRESKTMLNGQAGYVRGVCDGDALLLESSGFALARTVAPLPAPKPPADLQVDRVVEEGVLKVRWKAVRGARMYSVQMMPEGGSWEPLMRTSRVNHLVKELTTGKAYSFRVQVEAASGVSEMSETVTQRAA